MAKHLVPFSTLYCVLLAVGSALPMGSVLAEEAEGVVVEAVRSVTVERTSSGIPIKEITIKQRVSYADLDLTTQSGASKLEERIRQTAKSACGELDQKYPYTVPGPGKDCLQGAIDGGMVEARKAIDAAKSRAAKSTTN